MRIIPLNDVPAQVFTVNLGSQFCRINLSQKSTGLFLDLYILDSLITGSRICRDRDRMIRGAYLGFDGNLIFADQQGADDPRSPGLGTRFLLYYLDATELLTELP